MRKATNTATYRAARFSGGALGKKVAALLVAFSLVVLQIPITAGYASEDVSTPNDAAAVSADAQLVVSDKAIDVADTDKPIAENDVPAESIDADQVDADAITDDEDDEALGEDELASLMESEVALLDAGESEPAPVDLEGSVEVATAEELAAALADADVTAIVLTEDIAVADELVVSRDLTVSSQGGKTLSRTDRTKSVFVVNAGAALTLCDIALADNGGSGNASNYASAIVANGTLNLNSGARISGFKAADGGAVTAMSGSNVAINGATLSDNAACGTSHAAMGGAVYAKSGSAIVFSSGSVEGNVASSESGRNGGIGGGFYIDNGATMTMNGGTISSNEAGFYTDDSWSGPRNGAGGGVFVGKAGGFVMNSGTVTSNTAWAGTSGVNIYGGGGICIWNSGGYDFSGKAQLVSGTITNNMSGGVGGGIYVHNYRLLPLHNAAVVNNTSSVNGGGLYLCMVGEVYNYATDSTIFTGNDTEGQGDDVWSDEPWYGSKVNTHLPERTAMGEPIDWYIDTSSNPYTDASEPIENFTQWFEGDEEAGIAAAKNNNCGLHCGTSCNTANYAVVISGNSAKQGGGIGCNGILEMCNPDEDDVSLSVNKVWGDDPGDGSTVVHPAVTVNVFNGSKQIDTVELSSANNWAATLTGLPADGNYSVTEVEVAGYVASIERTSDTSWEFTITNNVGKSPVTFAKTDIAGSEIAGAVLAVVDAANTQVDSWTSVAGETHTVELLPGAYTFVELSAPEGYQKARDVAFVVDDEGNVTLKDADGNDVDVDVVSMTDAYAEAFVGFDFTKYLFANDMDQTFSFTLAECDAQGNVGDVVAAQPYVRDDLTKATVSADDPITVTANNGEFVDFEAAIDFPQLRYTAPGTHFYRVSENDVSADGDLIMDDSWYLLAVQVSENVTTGALSAEIVSQVQYFDGEAYDVDIYELAFCNNEVMTMSCFSMAYGFAPDEDQALVIAPAVEKQLIGRSLVEGEFSFKMVETTPGSAHQETLAANDAQGRVSFGAVSFAAPGTYTYDISEVQSGDATVSCDDSVITMTVEVTFDENGALQGEPVYTKNGEVVDSPLFVNTASKPVIRVQKTSKDGSGDPLANAYYGLWMKNNNGADVYLGAKPSDEMGYVTFDDVDVQLGASYYFKEVSAPAGHTVDEYPSDLFKVVRDGHGYRIVYEGEIDFEAVADEPQTYADMPLAADEDRSESEPVMVLTYEREGKGVQDEVVKFEMSKFDKDTHEYVAGAEFQIIEEASGKAVVSWTTGAEPASFERLLNVDTRYILRETKAPTGYATAQDTVFTIGEYGDLTVISGDDAEIAGKYSLDVCDVRLPIKKVEETVEKTERVVETDKPAQLFKTGDSVPFAIAGVVAGIAVIALAILLHRKRRA